MTTEQRLTSDWDQSTSITGFILGRSADGNKLIPASVFETFIKSVISSTASNADGAVNFKGAWSATTDYAPNDLVSYGSKIYLLIAAQEYLSSTTPDKDSTNWLCLYGQIATATDLNTVPNLSYFYAANSTNTPQTDPYGYGFTILQNNSGIQLFWPTDGQTLYSRTTDGNTWTAWVVLAAAFQKSQTPGGDGTIYVNVQNEGEFLTTVTKQTELNISGWPATGKVARFRWEVVNGGAFPTTFGPYNNLRYIKSDGSLTTNFADLGIVWNVSGPNFFEIWSRDAGANVYLRALVS